jgi:SAM-dependent methyltransferase
MNAYFKLMRRKVEEALLHSPQRHLFSPVAYAQHRVTRPLVQQYAAGRLIDLGCGDMPYRAVISGQVSAYESLDFYPRRPDVTYTADLQEMLMLPDGGYDSALCLEVLEHIPNPFKAVAEIARILKPGGVVVVSVPHLHRLHDEPHDYYRFTAHGLRFLLEQAGLEVLALETCGGLLTFIGQQVSTVLITLTWGVPVLRQVAWFLNAWLVTRPCFALDRCLDRAGLFAQGYAAAARKHEPH